MSSPYLNNLIIIGCILTYTSVILLGLNSGLTNENNFPYICAVCILFLSLVVLLNPIPKVELIFFSPTILMSFFLKFLKFFFPLRKSSIVHHKSFLFLSKLCVINLLNCYFVLLVWKNCLIFFSFLGFYWSFSQSSNRSEQFIPYPLSRFDDIKFYFYYYHYSFIGSFVVCFVFQFEKLFDFKKIFSKHFFSWNF